MALKDSVDKELNSINEKIKFYRNVAFGILSGLVWVLYNADGAKLVYYLISGLFFFFGIVIRLKFLEAREKELIEQLKDL